MHVPLLSFLEHHEAGCVSVHGLAPGEGGCTGGGDGGGGGGGAAAAHVHCEQSHSCTYSRFSHE